jgi:hypothetical protein
LNEPGVSKTHSDFHKYTKIIEYKNIEIAILKMITRNDTIFPKSFDFFYSIMKEHFLKNKDILKKFLQDKIKENKDPEIVMTSFYNMKVSLDYEKLERLFIETVSKI